jgi:hypothetical protein
MRVRAGRLNGDPFYLPAAEVSTRSGGSCSGAPASLREPPQRDPHDPIAKLGKGNPGRLPGSGKQRLACQTGQSVRLEAPGNTRLVDNEVHAGKVSQKKNAVNFSCEGLDPQG